MITSLKSFVLFHRFALNEVVGEVIFPVPESLDLARLLLRRPLKRKMRAATGGTVRAGSVRFPLLVLLSHLGCPSPRCNQSYNIKQLRGETQKQNFSSLLSLWLFSAAGPVFY